MLLMAGMAGVSQVVLVSGLLVLPASLEITTPSPLSEYWKWRQSKEALAHCHCLASIQSNSWSDRCRRVEMMIESLGDVKADDVW